MNFRCLHLVLFFFVCFLIEVVFCFAEVESVNSSFKGFKENFLTSDDSIKEGDAFYEIELYPRALISYNKGIQESKDEQSLMQAKFRLGLVYIKIKNLKKAIEILSENIHFPASTLSSNLNEIRQNSLYLLALIHQIDPLKDSLDIKNKDECKKILKAYTDSKEPHLQNFYTEALFERGRLEFIDGHYDQAKNIFQSLKQENLKSHLSYLTDIYLSRLQINFHEFVLAKESLEVLSKKINREDPLFLEISYLLGVVNFNLHEYSEAITHFQKSLSLNKQEIFPWSSEALYYKGLSCFNLNEDPLLTKDKQFSHIKQAEESFKAMLSVEQSEKGALALAQCYLSKSYRQEDEKACDKADALLVQKDLFQSEEGKQEALLLRAESARNYQLRQQLYQQLTSNKEERTLFTAKGWFMQGVNEYHEARVLEELLKKEEASLHFLSAAKSFKEAFQQFKGKDEAKAFQALKMQALACSQASIEKPYLKAFLILDEVIDYALLSDQADEILCDHGFYAIALLDEEERGFYIIKAEKSLNRVANKQSLFTDLSLNYLGALFYQIKAYEKAEESYLLLANTYPKSPFAAEALLHSAKIGELLHRDEEIIYSRKSDVFNKYPDSYEAPEAYFTLYHYPEYLQGDRQSIKHLEKFSDKFPNTPFLIEAYYLIGLDCKRDRKTVEGKWIRKKNLNEAIDAFLQVENLFQALLNKGLIPQEKRGFYENIRARAILERGLANLSVAEDSKGAKRQIYLEYAEEVFNSLIVELNKKDPLIPIDSSIFNETSFGLALTLIKQGSDSEADIILSNLIESYKNVSLSKSYYLARAFDERGKLAFKKEQYPSALKFFKQAEEASKGNLFNTDQRLNLLIQQSYCYRQLKNFDDALLILSRVVNSDAVSSLRMKAMFLRSEVYESQGRMELARKQLESIVKTGGNFADQAKQKLESHYGY